jgi:hypothetical protein
MITIRWETPEDYEAVFEVTALCRRTRRVVGRCADLALSRWWQKPAGGCWAHPFSLIR